MKTRVLVTDMTYSESYTVMNESKNGKLFLPYHAFRGYATTVINCNRRRLLAINMHLFLFIYEREINKNYSTESLSIHRIYRVIIIDSFDLCRQQREGYKEGDYLHRF